jgi:hypothetical protein
MCLTGQAAREAILAELDAIDPGTVDAAGLMRDIESLSRFISQLQAGLARLTGVLDASGGAAGQGHKSTAAFLRTSCGMADGHAAGLVAASRGLRRLTATSQALRYGHISFDKAQIVVQSVAWIEEPGLAKLAEDTMLGLAPAMSPAALRQLGEEIAYRADPDNAEEREKKRWERRQLSLGLTLDSTGLLHGVCGDSVSFEIIRTAAEAFAPPGGELDNRTAAQRRMDGLVTACRVALDTGTAPIRHGAAPHVSVLVRDETLARAPQAPPARTGHGSMLTASQVLALCCGAQLTAIRWADGLPLDVGRASRTEPPGLRRALEARDRTCRWTGCDTPGAWCTGHHLNGWANGARTSLPGQALLCHVHHNYFIHQLGWRVSGDANGTLRFTSPSGQITLESPLPGRSRAP